MTQITKADIAAFREVLAMHKAVHAARKRLCKKLGCEFYEVDEWADRLGKRSHVSDEDVCFAIGRLAYDD